MSRVAVALVALALVACAKKPDTSASQVDSVYYNIPQMNVYEFKLKDGTRCIAMDGNYSGGITCNWSRE